VAGGLVDIEFIAQIWQLIAARNQPAVLDQNTIMSLRKLSNAGAIDAGEAEALIAAARLEHGLTQVLRIAVDGPFKPESATRGLKALLARASDSPDFSAAEAGLVEAEARVRAIFERLMT